MQQWNFVENASLTHNKSLKPTASNGAASQYAPFSVPLRYALRRQLSSALGAKLSINIHVFVQNTNNFNASLTSFAGFVENNMTALWGKFFVPNFYIVTSFASLRILPSM
ncbi:MAG: hypothetical protein R3E61_07900 [Pseudomonadales bacterium]